MASLQQILAQLSGFTPENAFDKIYRTARDFEAAEKRGDVRKLKELDCAVVPQCIRCQLPCMDVSKQELRPLKCGRCRAVNYCSKECQIVDWKKGTHSDVPPHKEICPRNVEHMKRLPYFRTTQKQFPWFRMESDGSCAHEMLKARLGVLGSGLSYGYWSIPGWKQPHDASSAPHSTDIHPNPSEKVKERKSSRIKEYVHGAMLLEKEWPEDSEAWKLKENLFPGLKFDDLKWFAPKRPAPDEVKDWISWYKWRGLSLESPAALIMDGALSVYHLLANVLKVVVVKEISTDRQKLCVHLLGVGIELNFLPLLSELALLLPQTDIVITLFGKPVFDLVAQARRDYPGSLATRDIVWSYTAPESTGAGSVSIKLHDSTEFWTRETLRGGIGRPDAMVALNDDLLSSSAWGQPIVYSALFDIPFAITECTEQSLEMLVTELPVMLAKAGAELQEIIKGRYSQDLSLLGQGMTHPIAPNPFHRPGQRALPVACLPYVYNGFTLPVVLIEEIKASAEEPQAATA